MEGVWGFAQYESEQGPVTGCCERGIEHYVPQNGRILFSVR